MKRQRITIIDLAAREPSRELFGQLMNANYASVMPQSVAVWCEEFGHAVNYICYTGTQDIFGSMADDTDILFVGGFTYSAYTAYALSRIYQKAGAVTVLGGPHARCYPDDAAKYFDYVLGFTGREEIAGIITDASPNRPLGRYVSALKQPPALPGVRERWPFIQKALKSAPAIKIVPMIGSMGCPYTCNFCIDATVDYQPLGFDQITEDLKFLRTRMKRPVVGWHDPNFGIRFDDYLNAIEEAVPPGSVNFVAESSLSLLSEKNMKRLARNGFAGLLPGIESWYEYGYKSKSTKVAGEEKVKQVADQINMILSYVPFVQTNFVLGLDCDQGAEPFELTKKFLDLAPGAYPAFSLFTAYGQASPLNLDLQKDGRVLPVPFYLLDSNHAMNIIPKNYDWPEFFRLTADLTRYSLSAPRLVRRFGANSHWAVKIINFMRSITSDRIKYHRKFRHMLETDQDFKGYFDGRNSRLPDFFTRRIKKGLGFMWDTLPEGFLNHDHLAYSRKTSLKAGQAAE